MSSVYENMNTKGWRHDVTDTQVLKALEILRNVNKTMLQIMYEVITKDKSPSRVFGCREFSLILDGPSPRKIKVASFDSYGNFMIYPSFLEDGGITITNNLLSEESC